MPISSRIEGPTSVELGKTGTGRISVMCWNVGGSTSLKYGIGYKVPSVGTGKSSWHGWKNYEESVLCDQVFEFTFEVTQDMWDKQKAGNSLFIYSCDGMADRPIAGVGKGRYSYFAVTKPGVTPIGGRVWVATRISNLHATGKTILRVYADEYKGGRIYQRSDKYGGAYARPDGKVFREDLAGFWSYVRFMRGSLYNKLEQDEKDWLITRGVAVVPEDWSPAEGVPGPIYQLAGAFAEVPGRISIEPVPGWGVKLGDAALPVTFDLTGVSCTDIFGTSVTPPDISGKIPVMFSVNDITIASLTPASRVSLDLASLFSLWSTALTMGVAEITLTAWTGTTTIEGVLVPGISVSRKIRVEETVEETCKNICVGADLYSQKCVNGVCMQDALIEANSDQCGYVPPAPMLARRTMEMAIPKIMYEGQSVDIVMQSYYGITPSTGEPATLTVDGATVDTKNTSAGTVKFKWTAAGVGMHNVCVRIPGNPVCEVPGSVCKTITVSAYVEGIMEQIKAEKQAYDEELARLRELKETARKQLGKVIIPGKIEIPSSLAGTIVEIGGVPTTVPPGGISIPAAPGETFVTIIEGGVKKIVTVIVSAGETVTLPGGLSGV